MRLPRATAEAPGAPLVAARGSAGPVTSNQSGDQTLAPIAWQQDFLRHDIATLHRATQVLTANYIPEKGIICKLPFRLARTSQWKARLTVSPARYMLTRRGGNHRVCFQQNNSCKRAGHTQSRAVPLRFGAAWYSLARPSGMLPDRLRPPTTAGSFLEIFVAAMGGCEDSTHPPGNCWGSICDACSSGATSFRPFGFGVDPPALPLHTDCDGQRQEGLLSCTNGCDLVVNHQAGLLRA